MTDVCIGNQYFVMPFDKLSILQICNPKCLLLKKILISQNCTLLLTVGLKSEKVKFWEAALFGFTLLEKKLRNVGFSL